jgi:hypothetical protein
MRSLDSAISLSKKINQSLYIIWVRDSTLNCSLDELFIIPKSIEKLKTIHSNRELRRLHRELLGRFSFLYYDKWFDHNRVARLLKQGYNFEELAGYNRIFISSCDRFHESGPLFQEIVPIKPLQDMIDSYTEGFHSVVGVHIRRGDHVEAIKHSTTYKFIELMNKEVDEDQDTRFFLATDSPDEEHQIKEAFPGRIITHKKRSLDRNNPHAIQDALIDLYCLSRCRKLIGSYWSSFSRVAWRMNGIDKVIIRPE